MNTVTVIGSINLDQIIRVEHSPKLGETIHAKEVLSAGGGKGANQAVAAKRLGSDTSLIGAIANDSAGNFMLNLLKNEGIDLRAVTVMPDESTGQAYIVVDDMGGNSIMVHSGVNIKFMPNHVKKYEDTIKSSDFVIAQFESNLDSTVTAFNIARTNGVKTILNPAPAFTQIPAELLAVTDIIIPNETETEIITGITVTDETSLIQAANKLHAMGIEVVVITIGENGSFFDFNGKSGIIPATKVTAVDTTAAGDTFIGAFSSILKKDFSNLEEAIAYGNQASALTVQRYGAQPSIPYKNEM